MAEDRSVGGLYLRLGLSLSELETGFVTAERTVAANISRLNRESDLIRIRSEIEIAGLDETADAERILQIRTETLNRQMAIQRDRVRILTAELQSLTAAHGENSTVAQRAAVRLERERLTLANLERDLRSLNDAQGESNNSFGELNDMLPAMPTKLQAVGIAFGAVTAGIGAAATATNELLNNFRELQNQSYELDMSFFDTRHFLRQLRLANGDIGDFEGYIRGITDAFVKGEYDDPEFVALRKYGAEITDATGRLKDFKDITEEVYQAWKQADAAGEGIEFLQLTGGEAGVRDAIQFFKRYEEAKEDAAKIVKAEIDDKQLHALERTMNLVEEQSRELRNALGDIFVPAVQAAAENFFNVLHDGTAFLAENKDEIQKWGFVASEVLDTIASKVGGTTDWLAETAKTPKGTTGNTQVDKTMSAMNWRYQDFNQQIPFGVNTDWDKFSETTKKSYGIFSDEVKRAEERQKAFNGELNEATTVAGKMAQGLAVLSAEQKKNGDVLSQYGIQRVKAFKDELADLQIELDFGDNDYQKSRAELDLWRQRELTDKLQVSVAEREAIEKLYSAKLEMIERERADKLAEIRASVAAEDKTPLENTLDAIEKERQAWLEAGMDEAETVELAQKKIAKAYEESHAKIQEHLRNAADIEFELTHSAFEKQLRDIEQWRDAQAKKAESAEETASIIAEAAAKEAQAFESEMDRIKGTLQSLEDKIFAQEHSRYENDLRRAQQERIKLYEEYQQKGILDEGTQGMIERWYKNETQSLRKKAAESRKSGSDYTKSPKGQQGWGVIDFNAKPEPKIGLQADISRFEEKFSQGLSQHAQGIIAATKATNELAEAQRQLTQETQNAAKGFEVIGWGDGSGMPQQQGGWGNGGEITQLKGGFEVVGWGDNVPTLIEEFGGNVEKLNESVLGATATISELGALQPQTSSADKYGQMATGSELDVWKERYNALQPNTLTSNLQLETVVTPLNNINTTLNSILSALSTRQQPQVNISSSVSNNLGGAYVFDNAMKQELVNDITANVVEEIKKSLQQATRKQSFSYSS